MAKRLKKKSTKGNKISKKILFILLIFIMLVALIISIIRDVKSLKKISDNIDIIHDESNNYQDNTVQEQNTIEVNIEEVPDTVGSYKVLGTLVIDKIELTKNILDKTTDESLNLSVTKFYGPKINEKGNFCITGHNYKDTFAKLDNIKINDTFYIIDKENEQKVTYKVYDKYTVNPNELDCLDQNTNGKREVTIITCNPGGLTRLIVKAKEV